MTNDTSAVKAEHPWSAGALLAKAQLYAGEMLSHSPDDWHFGLMSTFVLEFIARAALSHINRVLLAEPKDWNNTYFAIGGTPTAAKFIPRSIDITTVLTRLRDILPSFTSEQEGFAAQHLNRRNEELHTGSTPFGAHGSVIYDGHSFALNSDHSIAWKAPGWVEHQDVIIFSRHGRRTTLKGPGEGESASWGTDTLSVIGKTLTEQFGKLPQPEEGQAPVNFGGRFARRDRIASLKSKLREHAPQ